MARKTALLISVAMVFALAACGKKAEKVTFKAGSAIAANVEILVSDGKVGKSAAVMEGYRPRVTFAGATEDLSCVIHIANGGSIEPGQKGPATIECEQDVSLDPAKAVFDLSEGGRKIGGGAVLISPTK